MRRIGSGQSDQGQGDLGAARVVVVEGGRDGGALETVAAVRPGNGWAMAGRGRGRCDEGAAEGCDDSGGQHEAKTRHDTSNYLNASMCAGPLSGIGLWSSY